MKRVFATAVSVPWRTRESAGHMQTTAPLIRPLAAPDRANGRGRLSQRQNFRSLNFLPVVTVSCFRFLGKRAEKLPMTIGLQAARLLIKGEVLLVPAGFAPSQNGPGTPA